MDEPSQQKPPTDFDFYKILIETRNFEINLFWQRCNYFLVLNTAVAVAFFNIKTTPQQTMVALLGLSSSVLWIRINLGSKYWQARWEQRLLEFEKEHFPPQRFSGLPFFGASPEQVNEDAKHGLEFHSLSGLKKKVYRRALDWRPSVSYTMIWLSFLFALAWCLLLVSLFVPWKADSHIFIYWSW